MPQDTKFHYIEPSPTVQVHLPDGKTISGPRGAAIGEFLKIADDPTMPPIVGAIVNNQLRELTYPIERESNAEIVSMRHADGMRFYRRSLIFLLEASFHKLFRHAVITIDHSVVSGGFFCQVFNRSPLSTEELKQLEDTMRQYVAADLPFIRKEYPLEEAIQLMKTQGYDDKVRLLKHRKKTHLVLYSLEDHKDYHHGYMVPSTGYLKWFKLTPMGDGFILRFPRRHKPTELLPLPNYMTLLDTFRQYGDWLVRLGIDSVGALNTAILEDQIQEIILVSEALHEQRINEIAEMVADRIRSVRIILIAGPSSSGKTTFSKRLSIQMLARGISPFPLEMDNYFVDRELTPRDENGEFNFEAIEAVDTQRLGEDLQKLIAGEKVQLPHFNFKAGRSEPGEIVQLQPGQIIIVEGIHGLNPKLLPNMLPERIFKIFVSALTQLNLDRHNRVSTTDTRLIRRIVRDARERGYSAEETINRWESVRRGEKRYIYPYQENADVMFNSALVYELAALKPLAEPLLRQVTFGTGAHIEAKRLLTFLDWFLPTNLDDIPQNSILNEFLGNSSLKSFKIWRNR